MGARRAALLVLALSSVALPSAGKKFRWCTLSDLEQRKCSELSRALLDVLPPATINAFARVSCIRAHNTHNCIDKIRANKADAAALDAGDVYSAVKVYGLTAVAKELYLEGSCVFAVAVARRGTLAVQRLKGARSCHNGARWTSGWNIPIGFLLAQNGLVWNEGEPLGHVLSSYFNASCVPGIGAMTPQLCHLCQGQKSYIRDRNHFCEASGSEPFYGSEGAFSCLKRGVADVAFLDHLSIMNATEFEQEAYVLLCPDGSTASLGAYATCNLGHGPGRVVVTRHNFQNVARKFLVLLQRLFGTQGKEKGRFELFASAPFRGKDLMFQDATRGFQLLREEPEISRVLGLDYVALLQGLGHEGSSLAHSLVRWCCISDAELHKCEEWALNVRSDPLVCVQADSVTHCIELIKSNEADAVTVDATHAYFAAACALVPVAAECYGGECASSHRDQRPEKLTQLAALPPLYALALVKKDARHGSIYHLAARRSCHSYMFSPAGWLLPAGYTVGAVQNDSTICNLSSAYQDYFWKGCMPGSDGNLCKVCVGRKEAPGKKGTSRCAANHDELYYGNLGALSLCKTIKYSYEKLWANWVDPIMTVSATLLPVIMWRCLIGDPSGKSVGDVAFLEHHNLLQNIEYLESSGWAKGSTPENFELLCPDGSRAPITNWKSCNLGYFPPNMVVTRSMAVTKVYSFLAKSQELSVGTAFQLFQSQKYGGSDLLFKDATECLVPTSHLKYSTILGQPFFRLVASAFNCTNAGILDFCKQDICTGSA